MRHVDPNGGNGSAAGLEGAIDLLSSRVVVSQTVEGKAREGVGKFIVGKGELLRRHDGRVDGPIVGLG